MATIKGNIILNGINTLTGIIFPVITFPYAARVLLPDGIGAVNFLNSIISYIVLLTSLGIPMYAVKEISKYRDNSEVRDKVTIEIIVLSTILCLCGYIVVWILATFVPQINQQSALFYILSLTIIFNAIGVNWFYQAVEDFKFITIRAIIVRSLSAVALFLFVKSSSDILIYGLIIVGSTVGNNILNFVHLRKYINTDYLKIRELKITRHLKPAFEVFILNLIISLYIQLNSIMLGFMSGDEQVGYFAAGTKISHIGLTVIASIGTVMLPRCSYLLKNGNIEGFKSAIGKSLNLTLGLSFPMTVGLIILATPITIVFCGNEYISSIPVLILNAPIIIFVSLTNLMGIQILYPMDKIKIVILSVAGGAILNLIFNIILIPDYGALGAAISTLIAEFAVLILQIFYGRNYFPFKMKSILNWKYLVATIVMTLFIIFAIIPIENQILILCVGIIGGAGVYMATLVKLKDSLTLDIILTIKHKLGYGVARI